MSLSPSIDAIIEALPKADSLVSGCNSRRLFHGRGQSFDGLGFVNVDLFFPILVVTVFDEQAGTWELDLCRKLSELLPSVDAVVIQRRYQKPAVFECIVGTLPDELFAYRNGLKFQLSLTQQNIGFFLDIEPARVWLESVSCDQAVLNLFSYTCVFSVVAMAAGASSVVNMDLSSKSLNVGRANHRLNEHSTQKIKFYAYDILKSWGRIRREGPFGVVIVDPPSFQKGSFVATRDYKKVLNKMPELIQSGGYALVCLNSPEVSDELLQEMASECMPGFTLLERLPSHVDFPDVSDAKSLKLLVFQKSI